MKQHIRLFLIGVAAVATLAAIFATHTGTAIALTDDTTPTPLTHGCGNSVTCVINAGNQLISVRITALNALIARANANKGLSPGQLTAITGPASTDITGLQGLQKTLDAETGIAGARTDVHNIFAEYRIFAVEIPLLNHTMWLDDLSDIQMKLAGKESTIEADIQKAGSPGDSQQAYTDMVNQINQAASSINAAQLLLPSLTPANYPGTDQTLKTVRTDTQAAHTALKTARADLEKIIADLKK